jgi:hypothetical protein
MNQANTAISRYEKASLFLQAYYPSPDGRWNNRMRDEFQEADAIIQEHGLQNTSAFRAAVLRAEQVAHQIRLRIA